MSVEGIVNKVWMTVTVPDTCPVKTMLLEDERKLLFCLASEYCRGRGCIVDAGCFLGGSTTALALGVRPRQPTSDSGPPTKIHSYDLFQAEAWTIGMFLPSKRARGRFNFPQSDYLERSHQQYITGPAWTSRVDAEGHLRAAAAS